MRIQDVMTTGVQKVSPGTAADEAWDLMRLKGLHHLIVMDGTSLAGVLSDRDMGGRQGATVRKNRTVADLMTKGVVTVAPAATVRQAANVMRGRSIGCLVVTEKRRIAGIVTVSDLLTLLGQGGDRGVESTKRWTLRHRAPHKPRRSATGVW